jgi:uncharacterized protein (DUF1697 family)
MGVFIAMLRGVNVGGNNMIKMEVLREICTALKFRGAQTYVQSGNVVFACDERDAAVVEKKLAAAIEKKMKFRPGVMVRTAEEVRAAVARSPFAKRRGINPKALLVTFLTGEPDAEGLKAARAMKTEPEELHIFEREAYSYFPNGMARPKIVWTKVEKMLKVSGTGRNWNSVNALLKMAEEMEAAG